MSVEEFNETHEHDPHRDEFVGLDDETRDELWDEYCWCGAKIRRKRWNEDEGYNTVSTTEPQQ